MKFSREKTFLLLMISATILLLSSRIFAGPLTPGRYMPGFHDLAHSVDVADIRMRSSESMPEDCHIEDIADQCPAIPAVSGKRIICDGYFWGSSAIDICNTGEQEIIGEGEEQVIYNVQYIRFPFQSDSEDEFQRILVVSLLSPNHGPRCGTNQPTFEELYQILWGEQGGDTTGWSEDLVDLVISDAFADDFDLDDPRERERHGLRREWTLQEKLIAGTQINEIRIDLRRAIDNGEYGGPLSDQRIIAEYIENAMKWMAHRLNPAYPNITWPENLRDSDLPPIYWDYIGADGMFDSTTGELSINILDGGQYGTAMGPTLSVQDIIVHELIHFTNHKLGVSHNYGPNADDITGVADLLFNEFLGYTAGDIFYRHVPAPVRETLINSRRFEDHSISFQMADEDYAVFMLDVRIAMVKLSRHNWDWYRRLVPAEYLRERLLDFNNEICDSSGCTTLYDILFTRCDNNLFRCPSRNIDEWTERDRIYFTNSVKKHYIEDVVGIAPFAMRAIDEFYAGGGVQGYLGFRKKSLENPLQESLIEPNLYKVHEPLQHENWLQGATGRAPNGGPSGTPAEAPGYGPPSGYDPTGNNGRPTAFTGAEPNDGWSSPPPASGIVEVPANVRQWPAGDSSGGPACISGSEPYRWCWDHVNWSGVEGSGVCRNLLGADIVNNCACSTRPECNETREALIDAAETTCHESCDDWPSGTQWMCHGGCGIAEVGEAVGEWFEEDFVEFWEERWEELEALGDGIADEVDSWTCSEREQEAGECEGGSGGSGGRNSGPPPQRSCYGTTGNGTPSCGLCNWYEMGGEYQLVNTQCGGRDWNTCCPQCSPDPSECLYCVNGHCGSGTGTGGGGGIPIGSGSGSGEGRSGSGSGESESGGAGDGGTGTGSGSGGSGGSGEGSSPGGGGSDGSGREGSGSSGGGSSEGDSRWGCCSFEDTVGQYCAICRWDGSQYRQESEPLTCPNCGDSGGVRASDETPSGSEWTNCGYAFVDTDVDAIVDTCGFVYCPSSLGCDEVIPLLWAGICLFEPGTYIGNCLEGE